MPIHTIQLVTPPLANRRFERSRSYTYDLVREKRCRVICREDRILIVEISDAKGLEIAFIETTIL